MDPFQRRPVWGEPAYFRLHGKGGYHYRHSDAELEAPRVLVKSFEESYVLFNNTAMFGDAHRFLVIACNSSNLGANRVAG